MIILVFSVVSAVTIVPEQMRALEGLMFTLTETREAFKLFAGAGSDCPLSQPGDGMVSCDAEGNVRIFHAFNKRLVGNLSNTDWSEFKNLTYVNLSQNDIYGTIPPSFKNLTRLQYLYLQRNRITGPLKEAIGATIINQLIACSLVGSPASSESNCFTDNLDADLVKCGGNAQVPLSGCINPPTTLPSRMFTKKEWTTVTDTTTEESTSTNTETSLSSSAETENNIGTDSGVDNSQAIEDSNKVALGVGLTIGCVVLVALCAVIGCFLWQRRKQRMDHSKMSSVKHKAVDMEVVGDEDDVELTSDEQTSRDDLVKNRDPIYSSLPALAASASIPAPIYSAPPAPVTHSSYDKVPPQKKEHIYEQADAPLEF
jgi:hypothetical protein